jgi:hypothetical protein
MSHPCNNRRFQSRQERAGRRKPAPRHALTLVELVLASSLMVVMVGGLAVIATGVQMNFEYGESYGTTTQHARVVLERMTKTMYEATANASFPGFIVLADTVGSWQFPDTLVVWHPASGTPANPQGLPLYSELVIYCPNPAQPNQLLEITAPGNNATVPAVTDLTDWSSNIAVIKQSAGSQVVVLTTLVRTCSVPQSATQPLRGALRFVARLSPSAANWSSYQSGKLLFQQLSWPQNIYGANTALAQSWVRIELQLLPNPHVVETNPAWRVAMPYFSSAAIYYPMSR